MSSFDYAYSPIDSVSVNYIVKETTLIMHTIIGIFNT